MPPKTRVVTVDGAGAGTVEVGPCWYIGANGAGGGSVTADVGGSLGASLLTPATLKFCKGTITLAGWTALSDVELFFEIS